MPSPGTADLASAIAPLEYTVEGGFDLTMAAECETVHRLASALHSGWKSKTPSTPTKMTAAMTAEFSDMTSGYGLTFMTAIGAGIDTEVAAWVSSWSSDKNKHTYVPGADQIYTTAMAASPIDSAAAHALAKRVADVFIRYFKQEKG